MFRTWGALKQHYIGPAHRVLTVVCPWCHREERQYSRVSDLEVHVRSQHNDQPWKPKEMFSRAAGFYLARRPLDYARVADNVTAYNTDLAFNIRTEVRKWAEEFDDRKERLDRINREWKEGEEYSKTMNRGRRSVSIEKSGETHKVSEFGQGSSKGQTGKEKHEKEIGGNNVGKDLKIKTVISKNTDKQQSISKNKIKQTHVTVDVNRMKITETDSKRSSFKKSESAPKEKQASAELTGDFYDYEYQCEVGEEKQVSEMLTAEKVGEKGDAGYTLDPNTGEFLPILDSESVERELGEVSDKETSEATRELEKLMEITRDKRIVKDSVEDKRKRKYEEEADNKTIKTPRKDESLSTKGVESVRYNEKETSEKEQTGLDDNTDKLELGEEAIGVTAKDTDGSTVSDSSGSSSSSSSSSSSGTSEILASLQSKNLRNRALAILSRGAMPLCPPARRLWTTTVTLEVDGMAEIVWPPTNWRALSPGLKLFAMEQIALQLERRNKKEFPICDKKELIDKYAFFMLEDQEKLLVGKSESEKIPDKIRQYNFSYLRGIIHGIIPESRTAWSIIKTLERCDRWTDTDAIVDFLEVNGIKIKV